MNKEDLNRASFFNVRIHKQRSKLLLWWYHLWMTPNLLMQCMCQLPIFTIIFFFTKMNELAYKNLTTIPKRCFFRKMKVGWVKKKNGKWSLDVQVSRSPWTTSNSSWHTYLRWCPLCSCDFGVDIALQMFCLYKL